MTNQQTAKASEPRKRTLDNPARPIATEGASVFITSDRPMVAIRHDQSDPTPGAPLAQGVTVVPAIPDEPIGILSRTPTPRAWTPNRFQRRLDERDFRGAGRGDMYSHRNTLAVAPPIHFEPFPRLVLPTAAPPFSPTQRSRR